MKQNILQNNFLYRPWEAIRFTVRLDRTLQGEILESAVQRAATRYPYLCVQVRRSADRCEISANPRPVPVFRGKTPLVLGSEAANGQYLSVGYEGDRLFFDVSHNLCDTKGLVPFVQTVLYLYLQRAADPELDAAGKLTAKQKAHYQEIIGDLRVRLKGFTHKDQKPYWT